MMVLSRQAADDPMTRRDKRKISMKGIMQVVALCRHLVTTGAWNHTTAWNPSPVNKQYFNII